MANNRTVGDLWREWTVGLSGGPSIEALERQWQSRWRPARKSITFFCRRKYIIDHLRALINSGMTEEEAIFTLERMRGDKSLNKLHDLLKEQEKVGRRGVG